MAPDQPEPAGVPPPAALRSVGRRAVSVACGGSPSRPLAHVALLVVFATITLTVMRKVEKIRVKVVDEKPAALEDVEGAPSLRDLAGVLKMARAVPNAGGPCGAGHSGRARPGDAAHRRHRAEAGRGGVR